MMQIIKLIVFQMKHLFNQIDLIEIIISNHKFLICLSLQIKISIVYLITIS